MSDDDRRAPLTPREIEILKKRFGIEAGADVTSADLANLAEVSRQFEITREKIREIERRALNKKGDDEDPQGAV